MGMDQPNELKLNVQQFVEELLNASSLDLRASVSENETGSILVEFQGFDLPLLLGHSAELLDSMQYITRRVFANEVADGAQIDFDASGYREARQHELELMAQKAAEKVRLSKVPFVFDPMNAQDRRIIHNALVDIEGVRTESEGDGQMRRVKILPAT
jgi:spoIIIJ-associated protein